MKAQLRDGMLDGDGDGYGNAAPAPISSSAAAARLTGYTDEANPFGDENLTKPFIWKKKYEKSIEQGMDTEILSKTELAKKLAANAEEIKRIKARKVQRQEEKEAMDALREQLAREAELENIEGWEEKEEEFHRQNAALRTQIRIEEGREKAVDILAKNMLLHRKLRQGATEQDKKEHPEWRGSVLDPALGADKDIELSEPYRLFVDDPSNGSTALPWRDLEFLRTDIEGMRNLAEKGEEAYWDACWKLCNTATVRQKEAAFAQGAQYSRWGRPMPRPVATSAFSASSSTGSVRDDIALLLRGKTVSELNELEGEIRLLLSGSADAPAALRAMSEGVDQNYWESVLKELQEFKALAYLREFHLDLLRARLADLQTFIRAEKEAERARRQAMMEERLARGEIGEAEVEEEKRAAAAAAAEAEMDFEPTLIPHEAFDGAAAGGEGKAASFSPPLHAAVGDELEHHAADARAMTAVDADADARALAEQRRLVAEQRQRELEERRRALEGSAAAAASTGPSALAAASSAAVSATPVDTADDGAYRRESSRPLEGDEVQMRQSVSLPAQTYWWHDKYRPRKPRFFNRVKTGYEWNKYNATHYDKENPPPKIVQGYKFNIFYPDLIDPSQAPRYRLEPDPDGNPDFCIIRFMAGPPYEDIAFKIVNKEWEYSFKRGYKCSFDRGVLCLYFNFRRYFYRR